MFNFLFPIISILGEALGNTFDKINFNKTKLKAQNQMFLVFLIMAFGSSLTFIFGGNKIPQFSLMLIFLIISIVLISFFQNIFQFHGISKKDLQTREPIISLQPIITVVIAYIIFPSEREIKYILAIILSVLVLYFFKFRGNLKISFDKGILQIFLGVFTASILANLYKFTLGIVSPEFLTICRTIGILIMLILFKQVVLNKSNFNTKQIKYGFLAGFFYFIGALANLYSIKELGLTFTILLLFLGPVFVFLFSFFILKEKVEIKNIISSIIILFIVIITIYL
ncbi:MAG: EamA family transporter [Candidatus Gracilibacteria bacterium]|nr:EamA family transporter [Candidatus Gracilibacteria bacterium]